MCDCEVKKTNSREMEQIFSVIRIMILRTDNIPMYKGILGFQKEIYMQMY